MKQIDSNIIIYNIDDVINEIRNHKVFSYDSSYIERSTELLVGKLELIKSRLLKNVRFEYLMIQDEMDRLYKIDKSLEGYLIYFKIKENANVCNFAKITYKQIKTQRNENK